MHEKSAEMKQRGYARNKECETGVDSSWKR